MSTFLSVNGNAKCPETRFSQRSLQLHPGTTQGAGVDISVSLSVEVTTTTSGTAARSTTGSKTGIVTTSCSMTGIVTTSCSSSMISGSGAVSAGMNSLKNIGLEVPGAARIDVLEEASRGLSR